MPQHLICAVCGDKTPIDQEHTCWVRIKLQEPTIHELCARCGELETNGFRHWRCWERTPDGQ
jgi:ribosomal protein L37E